MTITIFGSGLSGLISARMLADRKPVIYEKQDSLPNNHKAILRFRSTVVGDATNIPFREVKVIKAVHGGINSVSDSVRYSKKVTGKLQVRSILDLQPVTRYIAPSNMVSRLASTATIEFGRDFEKWTSELVRPNRPPAISTLPMPYMMDLFNWWDKPDFNYVNGWNLRVKLKPILQARINCTVYFPGDEPWYRASVTDDELIIEGVDVPKFKELGEISVQSLTIRLMDPLGLSLADLLDWKTAPVHQSRYQKIGDLSAEESESAKNFIMFLSKKHNIYSLGRFATWRPKLLLDDIVNDVRVIARLIDGASNYHDIIAK